MRYVTIRIERRVGGVENTMVMAGARSRREVRVAPVPPRLNCSRRVRWTGSTRIITNANGSFVTKTKIGPSYACLPVWGRRRFEIRVAQTSSRQTRAELSAYSIVFEELVFYIKHTTTELSAYSIVFEELVFISTLRPNSQRTQLYRRIGIYTYTTTFRVSALIDLSRIRGLSRQPEWARRPSYPPCSASPAS